MAKGNNKKSKKLVATIRRHAFSYPGLFAVFPGRHCIYLSDVYRDSRSYDRFHMEVNEFFKW